MDLQLMVLKVARRLRKVGFRTTLGEAFQRFREPLGPTPTTDAFDLKYGTDTGGTVRLWNFKIDSVNAIFGGRYEATDEQELIDAIDFLPEDPQNFTFLDLGCGKGRTLLVAANSGFKQVIGVEFVHELAETARKNLAKMQIANAVVVQADAAEYRFPDTDMVVYLYNPFSQEVMQRVVANLGECLSKKVYVIYSVPDCASIFDESGFLSRLGCVPGRAYIQIWAAGPRVNPPSA